MDLDTRLFRQTLGQFATGVAVALTEHAGDIQGMTVNSVASVSLEPMLVMFCPSKTAHWTAALERAQAFSLCFLREAQEPLSSYFAGLWSAPEPPAFSFEAWQAGAPRLTDCLSAVAGRVEAWVEGGDHWMVVARVTDLYLGPEPRWPLVFYGGRYRRLAPTGGA